MEPEYGSTLGTSCPYASATTDEGVASWFYLVLAIPTKMTASGIARLAAMRAGVTRGFLAPATTRTPAGKSTNPVMGAIATSMK